MKPIKFATIAVGDAYVEGRAPSHDGECLSVYYVPGDERYMVEDNAGLAWTYYGEEDVLNGAAEGELAELERQINEAHHIVSSDCGSPATFMGSAAIECAVAFGWADSADFDGGHVIGAGA